MADWKSKVDVAGLDEKTPLRRNAAELVELYEKVTIRDIENGLKK